MVNYWTSERLKRVETSRNFEDLVAIAHSILDLEHMQGGVIQVCGPISTGGAGSIDANRAILSKAINFFLEKGENIFDQMPFETAFHRFDAERANKTGYFDAILHEFYHPIFMSKKINEVRFLPDWESSFGARWEYKVAEELKIRRTILSLDWMETGNYAEAV